MSTPTWLRVGAQVATLRSDWEDKHFAPTLTTVDRVGKRDVVLSNGERFNINRLRRRDGGDWGWTTALLPVTDPVVAKAQLAHDHEQKVWRAKGACEDFRFDRKGLTAVDVILTLAPLTGCAEEIAALFDRTLR